MISIYAPEITPRIEYAFNLYLREILHIEFNFETDIEAFSRVEGPKISYHSETVGGAINLVPSGLLSQSDLVDVEIDFVEYKGVKCPFAVVPGGSLPFDPLAAGFYLVTRYEEYRSAKRDQLGRFKATESIAFVNGFLEKPVVNGWAEELAGILHEHYPDLKIPDRKFHFISTIDVDNAFAYLQKGPLRTLGGFAKSALYLDFYRIVERTSVLLGMRRDPYDTFSYIGQTTEKFKVDFMSFFLLGDYGIHDKNVPHNSMLLQERIVAMSVLGEVGMHPSVASVGKAEKVREEKKRLEAVLGNSVEASRQHYLKLTLPDTYRQLIAVGIKSDYSMGYSTHIGFRAGICTPFSFFDLESNRQSDLMVYPFAIMDVTLKNSLNQVPVQAIKTIGKLIEEVRSVRGTFISVWHNESLSENLEWRGWTAVYEKMLEESGT